MPPSVRLLIGSNDSALSERLASLAKRLPFTDVVVKASDGKEAVESYLRNRLNMALMDLRLPRVDCITAIHAIRAKMPVARIVLLMSSAKDAWVNKGLRAGVKGFLRTDAGLQELADCIYSVSEGRSYIPSSQDLPEPTGKTELTPRELEVLRLVAAGMSNGGIGDALFITEGTVKIHVHHILSKLGVESRSGAINQGVKRHLLYSEEVGLALPSQCSIGRCPRRK